MQNYTYVLIFMLFIQPYCFSQISFYQCDNCTNSNNNNDNVIYEYSDDSEAYIIADITSDFGPRRLPNYDWHGGIDYRDLDSGHRGRGDAIAALAAGYIHRIDGVGLKDIVVVADAFNYGYRHIFSDAASNNGELKCGRFVLKSYPVPGEPTASYRYAIIDVIDQQAFAAIGENCTNCPSITYNSVEYSVANGNLSNQIDLGQPLSPMGNSGQYAPHLHIQEIIDLTPTNGITFWSDRNARDIWEHVMPIEEYDDDPTDYNLEFRTQSNTVGLDLIYPGSSSTKIALRVEMADPSPIPDAARYQDALMMVDIVELFLKAEYEDDEAYKLIEGKDHNSSIDEAGIDESSPDNSNAYPNHILTQQGSWNTQGIIPYAYSDDEFELSRDDFYFTDFITRIHKDDPMDGGQAQIANCPDNARYNDGIYEIKAVATDVRGNTHKSELLKFTLDNFQPFLSSFTFNTGFLQFTRSWSCYTCGISLAPNPMLEVNQVAWNTWLQNPFWQLSVQASEPLEGLTLDILVEGNLLQEDIQGASSPNGIDWVFDLSQYASQLSGRVEFHFFGYDTNGNTLLAFSPAQQSAACLQVPTRNGANSWDNPDQIPSGPDNVFAVCIDCGGGGVSERSPENEGCAIIELVPDDECLEVEVEITSATRTK